MITEVLIFGDNLRKHYARPLNIKISILMVGVIRRQLKVNNTSAPFY